MPCSDVTEILRLTLDGEDRLEGYELNKRTCGQAVGESSLLGEAFAGRPAVLLLDMTADEFADAHPVPTDVEMFLQLKHLFAVQAGLRVLLGRDSGSATDAVSVASLQYDGDRVSLEADLAVGVITDKIKSCGRCKGCGVAKKK